MTEHHYTVSEVARLAHVSVRALHHYHDIGLLVPARRTAAGYRLYSGSDLLRLREILLFRELGLTLDAIGRLLGAPTAERAATLRGHRGELESRVRRTQGLVRAVDATLDALEKGTIMDGTRVFDGFDEFDHAQYAEEAEQRWGETEAWRESQRRTKQYTREDWARIRAEDDGVMARFAELLAAGRDPDDPEAIALAEEHRQHISRWFYPCDAATHASLAEMYVADPRFSEYFEKRREGLTAYVAAAIRLNAGTGGVPQ
ncbi:MAG TPA: MerR family transcriptional regulator [Longimicrobiales bacterium]